MKEKTKERLFVGLTAARLAQGIDLARRIKTGRPIVGATVAILAVDLLDSVLARWLGTDGPARRAADRATEAGIIVAGLYSTYKKHPKARPYVAALTAREAFVGAGWAIDLATSRKVRRALAAVKTKRA